jgi:hypothetical protein
MKADSQPSKTQLYENNIKHLHYEVLGIKIDNTLSWKSHIGRYDCA